MVNVAVIGVSGYTGLELVKILINHPYFKISFLANSEGGTTLNKIHPTLTDVYECEVEKMSADEVAKRCELAFLALPHKTAMSFAKELLALGVKVVDLSADYRLNLSNYEKAYCEHLDRENLKNAVYGLPEVYREEIKNAKLIANPGCYPTASLLGILPFLPYINKDIFIDAKSGVSGAGKSLSEKTHFVNVNENLCSYNPIKHRHATEISEKIESISGKQFNVTFVPHLLPLTRGMLVSVYATLKEDINVEEILREFYKNEKTVRVANEPVDIKSVAGTNFCDIFVAKNGSAVFISSAIDNLLRGASSQAVVNANLMYGYDENTAIPLISYMP